MADDEKPYKGFVPGDTFYSIAPWIFKLRAEERHDEVDKLIAMLIAADVYALEALNLTASEKKRHKHAIETGYRDFFSPAVLTTELKTRINKNVHRLLINEKAHIDGDVAEEARRAYYRLKDHKEKISKQNPDAAQKWWEDQIDLYHYLAKPLDEVDDGGSL